MSLSGSLPSLSEVALLLHGGLIPRATTMQSSLTSSSMTPFGRLRGDVEIDVDVGREGEAEGEDEVEINSLNALEVSLFVACSSGQQGLALDLPTKVT